MHDSYLNWAAHNTDTSWWHDSGDPDELALALEHGAAGVTTNPVLAVAAIKNNAQRWRPELDRALVGITDGEERALRMTSIMVGNIARMLLPVYERTEGAEGYVCAQVSPLRLADRAAMQAMARRYHVLAPNIAVKVPATRAGLEVAEDCIADGITITVTVSFTVAQALAIGQMHQRAIERAERNGKQPGRCFAVIMIGRIDDYLREIAGDMQAQVTEEDIRQAGLAIVKRAYGIFAERGYKAVLCIAALRGTHHMTDLAGGRLIMSVHPAYQKLLLKPGLPRATRIAVPVPAATIERLLAIPDFVRAYEPDGLDPSEFLSFGLTQRTLSQFIEVGWKQLAAIYPNGDQG